MRFAVKIGLLAVIVCLEVLGGFYGGLHNDLYAADFEDGIPEAFKNLTAEKTNNSQNTIIKNFDADFLKKDHIDPFASGFRDDLFLPAMKSPLAQKEWLNWVAPAGSRIVAVGVLGHILYSDDGGKTWEQGKVPTSVDLTAVYFPTPDKGWAVGHDGVILNSDDGGTTWSKQMDGYDACRIMDRYYRENPLAEYIRQMDAPVVKGDIDFMIEQGPSNPFLDVWFEDEATGFAVGAFNLIFRTEDGGRSWQPWFDRVENPMNMHLYRINSNGKDVYIVGEQGLVLRLNRAEKRFKALATPYTGTYFGILGNPDMLLVYGMRGNIYRSTDDGATWHKVELEGNMAAILAGSVNKEDGSIVLISQEGRIFASRDNGEHFNEIEREKPLLPAHCVVFADNSELVLAGMFGFHIQTIQ